MVFKLYGHPKSTCSQRVALVLKEKNVPYEYVPVSLETGEHKKEEFKAINPFGQIPYIDDDGLILYESRAICQHIANKYAHQGRDLIPRKPEDNAIYLQGCSIETSSFDSVASPLVYEKLFKPIQGITPDEHITKKLEEMLTRCLDGYERVLTKQKYIGGNELTLADIFHLPVLQLLPAIGYKGIDDRPAVSKWVKEISAIPNWQSILNNGLDK